jgi:hypothetical protein
MITKTAIKIKGILHREEKDKHNHEQQNDRNHYIPANNNTEC